MRMGRGGTKMKKKWGETSEAMDEIREAVEGLDEVLGRGEPHFDFNARPEA